jgi:hypothetical protein
VDACVVICCVLLPGVDLLQLEQLAVHSVRT